MNLCCIFFIFFAEAMKGSLIRRSIGSILVLLVFTQQVGAGLYIHNLCHKKQVTPQGVFEQKISGAELIVDCSCVDNFLTPFIEAVAVALTHPDILHAEPVDTFASPLHIEDIIFASLRGPPIV
ncbi:MAG: hypothetical protein EOO02_19410 [Chitinophagaceae bacterium]|nr:MAG: hypothetical protein EOO02_19410 [Chitinophagaceae bacterium]